MVESEHPSHRSAAIKTTPPIKTALLQAEFLKPKYWLLWTGILLTAIVVRLPLRARWATGRFLGRVAHPLAKKRRHVVEVNLALCFPELSPGERAAMVRKNFESSGIGIVETATAWFRNPADFDGLVDIEGLDELRAARAKGRGVLLIGMHLSTLDFCGAALGRHEPFDVMYRRNKNKLLEAVMTRGRRRNFPRAIERNDIRDVIRSLKDGRIVWYGPDQDYGRKRSAFAPFFGVPAATITATRRIAAMSHSPLIVFSHYRSEATGRYRISLKPLPGTFPGADEQADCALLNRVIEDAIRQAPEQYWWLHRRFKSQPEGTPRPYSR